MLPSNWQLKTPLDAIIFDCDGTLSAIEGIDELAEENHVGDQVSKLTQEAMSHTGLNPELYRKRLELVLPTEEQVLNLGKSYIEHLTPDAKVVIELLQRLNKIIYIISAGLYPAVAILGQELNIPKQNIFAVDIYFDPDGQFVNYDEKSILTHNDGKRMIVSDLAEKYNSVGLIGDGLNDYATHDLVTRFIGYGGSYYRQNIKSLCEYYIEKSSLAPLLPLVLTQEEYVNLTIKERNVYEIAFESFHSSSL